MRCVKSSVKEPTFHCKCRIKFVNMQTKGSFFQSFGLFTIIKTISAMNTYS